MKKAILFLLALILLSAVTNAQKSFEENSKVVNLGMGIGFFDYGLSSSSSYNRIKLPTISVSYEQGYKRVGPGTIGVGGLLSYQSTRSRSNYLVGPDPSHYYQHRYSSFVLAARAVYHWDELNFEKWEVYGGAMGGLRIQTYSYQSNLPEAFNSYRAGSSMSIWPVASLFAGIRYYFSPSFGVFAELSGGYGLPFNTIGISLKL